MRYDRRCSSRCGKLGKNLVRNFASLGDVELKYICDRIEAVRESMGPLYPQAAVTDDYQQLLDDDGVDAIVVAVEAPLHFELAAASLKAGKHTSRNPLRCRAMTQGG